jgi:hypothetical protein
MPLRVLCGSLILGLIVVSSATKLLAADAQPDELVRQIIKLIGDDDREFRAAGLEQVRTAARGPAYTQLFAAQLTKLGTDGQIALLDALADRGDVAARSAVLDLLASSPDASVRAAAIGALGRLGELQDLPLLVKSLADGSKLERVAARQSLSQISGETINGALAAALQSASPKAKGALIEVLATRRASDQLPAFVAATVDDNPYTRRAAMAALAQIGRPEQNCPDAARRAQGPKGGANGMKPRKSVALVCERIENEDQRGTTLIEALNTVDAAQRDQLLSLLGTRRRQEADELCRRDRHGARQFAPAACHRCAEQMARCERG